MLIFFSSTYLFLEIFIDQQRSFHHKKEKADTCEKQNLFSRLVCFSSKSNKCSTCKLFTTFHLFVFMSFNSFFYFEWKVFFVFVIHFYQRFGKFSNILISLIFITFSLEFSSLFHVTYKGRLVCGDC